MNPTLTVALLTLLSASYHEPRQTPDKTKPVRTEVVNPIVNETFNKGGKAKVRKQGGNPRTVNGLLVFDGSQDGNRQVDPQIAVGGGYVLHGTNGGIIVYDKLGNYVQGVPQSEFNDGIDPKLFYDVNAKVFGFDMWVYWDKQKVKPVNISVSATDNPLGTWYTYPVSATNGEDGGSIGHSRKWIAYSYPGGPEQTFVMKMADVKAGKPATVYHFAGNLGEAVSTQDPIDDLYFVQLTDTDIIITRVTDNGDGTPVIGSVVRKPHDLRYNDYPPDSPQKGTPKKTASGDRNPKNLVLQNRCIWFSQAVNIDGRSAVQWHQVTVNGTFVQSGRIASPVNSYIETTLAVNKHNDVMIGFQETGPNMFISPRCSYRLASDPLGKTRPIIHLGVGVGATEGGAWGDYSGSVTDGDNMTDFWTVQSLASAKGHGDCVIAKIPPKM